jgi:predicted nucleic acid-binding protein
VILVIDASVVVAALVDAGPAGRWAESVLASAPLVAPHLMPVEVANILRRATLAGEISADVASLAHGDLISLRVALFPYPPFASRVWDLRANLTAYDAWYVALAESLGARLATLDVRLSRAPGVDCEFATGPVGERTS